MLQIPRTLLRRVFNLLDETLFLRLNRRINGLNERLDTRYYALDLITEYLHISEVRGDYLEFGVFQGRTFIRAYRSMAPQHAEMRFHAFDSFQGLPNVQGIDEGSHFFAGQYNCDLSTFTANLQRAGVDLRRVSVVPGWFDATLTGEQGQRHRPGTVAAAWIDCDLYASTLPVLDFLTPHLQTGSVIYFDDWRCYKNSPNFGEQRACAEWLERNQHIELRELFSVGWQSIAFSVIVKG
jgi:hypothetical protein